MERKIYIQPNIEQTKVGVGLMQTISQNTGDAPVIDDGEELGSNSASIWDSEPQQNSDDLME
jgi:hypothetical protein